MIKKSIRKNYIYNLIQQILLMIVPLITTPYLSRVLGADGIGTVSYAESVSAYFVLFAALGLNLFGQREISYVQDNKEKRSIVFWETFILQCITSFAVIIGYIIFSLRQANPCLYFVLVFNLLSVTVNVAWFFQGIEEFSKIVSRNIIFKIINVIYIFLVVKSDVDLIYYLFGLTFFAFLGDVSLWLYLPRYIGLPKWQDLRPMRHLKVVFSLFVPVIAIKVYTVLDKVMIGVITKDAFENGYYEQAFKIAKLTQTIVTALGTVMIPRIGYEFERGNADEVRRLMYRGYKFVWFLGIPLSLGLICISANLVPWFYGDNYQKVVPLLNILSFFAVIIGISNVTGNQYLIPTKQQNIFTVSVAIGAVTNFLLNLILIKRFQSIGAAIASVVAEIVVMTVQLYFVRKELNPTVIVKSGSPYYIAGAVMTGVLYSIKQLVEPSIGNTFFLILCGMAVYGCVLLLMRDEFLLSLLNVVLRKQRE